MVGMMSTYIYIIIYCIYTHIYKPTFDVQLQKRKAYNTKSHKKIKYNHLYYGTPPSCATNWNKGFANMCYLLGFVFTIAISFAHEKIIQAHDESIYYHVFYILKGLVRVSVPVPYLQQCVCVNKLVCANVPVQFLVINMCVWMDWGAPKTFDSIIIQLI